MYTTAGDTIICRISKMAVTTGSGDNLTIFPNIVVVPVKKAVRVQYRSTMGEPTLKLNYFRFPIFTPNFMCNELSNIVDKYRLFNYHG